MRQPNASALFRLTLSNREVTRPLTEGEERKATAAALKHLGNHLPQRCCVYGVELRIPKSHETGGAPRYYAVVVGDYDRKRTLEVVVDNEGNLIAETDLTGLVPCIVSAGIMQARRIAEAKPIIAALAEAPGGFVQAFAPATGDVPEQNVVGLRYGAITPAGPRVFAEVEVDFGRQTLIRIEYTEALRETVN